MKQLFKHLLFGQEQMMAKMKAEMKTNQKMLATVIAKMDAWIEGVAACIGELEANQEKSDTVAEHQEVPKEKVAVETIRALEDQYGDWHLAVGHRQQLKKWTQGDGGSWKKMGATCRHITHRAIPAWCKGRDHKGQTVEKRQWKGLECNNSIRN
jgi:hypothetical protein